MQEVENRLHVHVAPVRARQKESALCRVEDGDDRPSTLRVGAFQQMRLVEDAAGPVLLTKQRGAGIRRCVVLKSSVGHHDHKLAMALQLLVKGIV